MMMLTSCILLSYAGVRAHIALQSSQLSSLPSILGAVGFCQALQLWYKHAAWPQHSGCKLCCRHQAVLHPQSWAVHPRNLFRVQISSQRQQLMVCVAAVMQASASICSSGLRGCKPKLQAFLDFSSEGMPGQLWQSACTEGLGAWLTSARQYRPRQPCAASRLAPGAHAYKVVEPAHQ